MKKSSVLLFGTIGLVLLWILMLLFDWDDIEKDVAGRTEQALQREGHTWAEVFIDNQGRDVSLRGIAREQRAVTDAVEITEKVYGVRVVDSTGVEFSPYQPTEFSVARGDDGASLSGSLPDQELANTLIDTAKQAFGPDVEANFTINKNIGTPGWLDGLARAVAGLGDIEQANLKVNNERLVMSGIARTRESLDSMLENISSIPAIPVVDTGGLELRPFKSPTLSVVTDDYDVKLTGSLSSEYAVALVAETAGTTFGGELSNGLEVDKEVADAPWLDDITRLMAPLREIEDGAMHIVDNVLTYSGTARSKQSADLLAGAMQTAADKLDVKNELELSPYKSASLYIDVSRGGISVQGRMPDQASVDRIIEGAGKVLSYGEVSNQLEVSDEVGPAPWVEGVASIMSGFKDLQYPGLSVTQDTLRVWGESPSQGGVDDYLSQVEDAAGNLSVDNAINVVESAAIGSGNFSGGDAGNAIDQVGTVETGAGSQTIVEPESVAQRDIDLCETAIDGIQQTENIEFALSSAELAAGSFALLDQLAIAVDSCPGVIIEIGGHTDNTGSEELNAALSENRALAVANYLIKAGVREDKLAWKGYGSSQPEADNETDAGRARNRRIEFNVIKSR